MSVKQLREMTGAGIMDCKKAFDAANGDIEQAIVLLQEKGVAKALKRSGNDANEGVVVIVEDDNACSMLQFGTETDFVAKNDGFCQFCSDEAEKFAKSSSDLTSDSDFVKRLSLFSGKVGEDLVLKNSFKTSKDNNITTYIHSNVNSKFLNIGKIGVVLVTKNEKSDDIKNIALHIAAFKPENIKELNDQDYLMDNKLKVAKFCADNDISVLDFKVFAV